MSTPAQSRHTSSALDADGLRIWSCVICRRRKVRCDRHEPCANCVRNNVECHYPVTGRIPRRRALPPGHPKSGPDKQSVLINRLRRLESIVTELSAQVEEGASGQGGSVSWQMPLRPRESRGFDDPSGRAVSIADSTPPLSDTAAKSHHTSRHGHATTSSSSNEGLDEDFGRLVVAKDGVLHVGNRFWTVFCDEVHNIFNAVEDVDFSLESAAAASELAPSDEAPAETEHYGYVFGLNPNPDHTSHLRPLPSQMMFLWQTYLDNVDPFIKILHTPTVSKAVYGLSGNIASQGPEMESLLLAISVASVVSLEDEGVATNFGQPKSQLLTNYRLGTEDALSRSGFLTKKSLALVQAFVIYLSVLPHMGEKQASWPLTGLLLRVATNLGLHRDGSHQSQMPFLDAELRRRLWWQICLVDSRGRDPQMPQLSVSETMFDTTMPANIADKDLESTGSSFASDDSKITTLSLLLIRCHIWRLGRTIESNKDQTVETQISLIRSARNTISSTYLLNVDNSNPFDSFIQTMTSLFFAKIEVLVYSQALRGPTVRQNRDSVVPIQSHLFNSSLEIIKVVYDMKRMDDWKKWRWQVQGHVPWHAMGIVLSQLHRTPWSPESEQAWGPTKTLFGSLQQSELNTVLGNKLRDLVSQVEQYRESSVASISPTLSQGLSTDTGFTLVDTTRDTSNRPPTGGISVLPDTFDLGISDPSNIGWVDPNAPQDNTHPMGVGMLDGIADFSEFDDLSSL